MIVVEVRARLGVELRVIAIVAVVIDDADRVRGQPVADLARDGRLARAGAAGDADEQRSHRRGTLAAHHNGVTRCSAEAARPVSSAMSRWKRQSWPRTASGSGRKTAVPRCSPLVRSTVSVRTVKGSLCSPM